MPWKPGQSGNPKGRPKGSRHKLTESVYQEFLADWAKHGVEAIAKMRETRPELYVQAAIRLVPTQHEVSVDDLNRAISEYSAEELAYVAPTALCEAETLRQSCASRRVHVAAEDFREPFQVSIRVHWIGDDDLLYAGVVLRKLGCDLADSDTILKPPRKRLFRRPGRGGDV